MRITLVGLAAAALFAAPAFGQTEKTFYFTHPVSDPDMTAVATVARTMLDMQDISVDREHRAVVTHGPVEKLVTAEWLFEQLDHTASATPTHYKMSGEKGEVIAVIPVAPTATLADLTAATTAIRTIVDLQRLFPYAAQRAIVGRGEPDKIAAAEWIVSQLSPYQGPAPAGDSPPYPAAPLRPDKADSDSLVRVLRMDPKTTTSQLTAMVTAIRTVADIQRLFPFEANKALIMRASPAQVAVAEWLVHEMAKPADAGTVHQITMPGLIDAVVRLFYVGQQTDVAPLAARIRTTVDILRVYPLGNPSAVVLRGRPDQMSTVEAMVAKFTEGGR